VKATPSFAARHNFNVVAKQYVHEITTQFGAILSWASGRPYNNPNEMVFMNGKTRDYLDLSLNISYLTTLFGKSTIVYISCSNVFGRDNIYGYRYYETPNNEGIFESIPVKPEAKRFFLTGVFITL
ncbi:MAG: TonB-dependent receptor, partial [Bacteroidales bacterium]|nr:TonB-dependent receptor [Bacteroidales bacterium]